MAWINQLQVSLQDMMSALPEIKPTAMREIVIDVPRVYWSDIGGYDDIKQKFKEAIEWPLKVFHLSLLLISRCYCNCNS